MILSLSKRKFSYRFVAAAFVALFCANHNLSAQRANRAAPTPRSNVSDTTFSNGLSVVVMEDHSAPLVAVAVVYDVGSVDEPRELNGITQVAMQALSAGSRGYQRGEFERVVQKAGGQHDAYSYQDATVLVTRAPKGALHDILMMESDRMESPRVTRESVESAKGAAERLRQTAFEVQTYAPMIKELFAQTYEAHPYGMSPFGTSATIAQLALEDVIQWMRSYFHPANAVLAIVGDIDGPATLDEVALVFADIPVSVKPPKDSAPEPSRRAERRVTVTGLAQVEVVMMGWIGPERNASDAEAVAGLMAILVGERSSRLFQSLVTGSNLCLFTGGGVGAFSGPGLLYAFAFTNVGKSTDEVERVMRDEIRRIAKGGISEAEVIVVKNQMEAEFYRACAGAKDKAIALAESRLCEGVATVWMRRLERIQRLTREDIAQAARQYLVENAGAVVRFSPDTTRKAQ